MVKRPTIKDLVAASGVSAATVDRVLNGRGTVRTSTALRVYDAAKQLGFHAAPLLHQRIGGELPVFHFGLLIPNHRHEFYGEFQKEFLTAAGEFLGARVSIVVEHLESIKPDEVVRKMEKLSTRVAAIGIVSIDHPKIADKALELKNEGVPIFALLSDCAQGIREAYIGTNNIKVGRVAASIISRGIAQDQGLTEVAIFLGGHRWHGHELREMGFRSWFRERRPDVRVLEPLINLDTPDVAYEATANLLLKHSGLRAIYCAGGGREGVIQAVREEHLQGKNSGLRIQLIVNELTESTRSALAEEVVSTIIQTPVKDLAFSTFSATLAYFLKSKKTESQIFMPINVIFPESL